MATISANLNSAIESITAQTGLTKADMKVIYIKNGGSVIYPMKDENGNLKLGSVSFRHDKVLTARAEKAVVRAQAKAERDVAKALKKAQESAAKAQAKAQAAAAKVAELTQPTVVA